MHSEMKSINAINIAEKFKYVHDVPGEMKGTTFYLFSLGMINVCLVNKLK